MLRKMAWFKKIDYILGVSAFYRIDFNAFVTKIVLSGGKMKMAENIDFQGISGYGENWIFYGNIVR